MPGFQVQWLTVEACGAGQLPRSFEEELGIESGCGNTDAWEGAKERTVDGEL